MTRRGTSEPQAGSAGADNARAEGGPSAGGELVAESLSASVVKVEPRGEGDGWIGGSLPVPEGWGPAGVASDSTTLGAEPPAEEAPARGALIGRYMVLERVGRGGAGEVVSAYDPELDRRVAVKLLRTARASERGKRRLVREARALAKLSHPNVVQVYDAGVHEGDVFIAMELVEGQSLKEWVKGEPRPSWKQVLGAYVEAARGLLAAHEQGIVHRDVKPANILRGKDGRVRVADFGLAWEQGRRERDEASQGEASEGQSGPSGTGEGACSSTGEASGSGSAWQTASVRGETPVSSPQLGQLGSAEERLTRTGTTMGTPAYMAPEQYASAAVGPLADQYSLSVSLYEGLYGTLPFAVEPHPKSPLGLMASKLEGRVVTPPADSRVPGWVYEALRRGLCVKPEARYPTLAELISALSDDPLERRRARRWRLGAMAGVLLLGAVAVAGWVQSGVFKDACGGVAKELEGAWDERVKAQVRAALLGTERSYAATTAERVSAALDRYAGQWVRMRTEVCEATIRERGEPQKQVLGLRDQCLLRRRSQLRALTGTLSAGPDTVVLDKAVEAAESLYPLGYCADDKALTARVPPPEDPAQRARVEALEPRVDRLEALEKAGKYKEGLAEGEALLSELGDVKHAPLRAAAMYQVGNLRESNGDYEGARSMLREALFVAAEGKDDVLATRAAAALLFVLGVGQQRFDEARAVMEWAPLVVNRADDELAHADWLNSLGSVLLRMGKNEEALGLHERVLSIREKALGPDHPDVATALNNLANVLTSLGRYEEAKSRAERALSIREKALGPDHPRVASALINMALVLSNLGRYEEAKTRVERAFSIWEKALGADHPNVATALNNLALLLTDLGRYEEAKSRAERALSIREKALGPDHPAVASALNTLVSVLDDLGRYEEAKSRAERALSILEKELGADHPDVAESLSDLGRILVHRGELEEAARRLQHALLIGEKARGKGHPDLAHPLLGLGELALARKAPAEALPVLERALSLDLKDLHFEVRLALSQALWDAGKDRPRAVALATEAREHAAGIGHKPHLAEATRWLAEHRLP